MNGQNGKRPNVAKYVVYLTPSFPGYITDDGVPYVLHYTTVPVIDTDECRKMYAGVEPIYDSNTCAGIPGEGKDACTVSN